MKRFISEFLFSIFAQILVNSAWLIPGSPHRWARRLKAERDAGSP